jgi:hypothetical protein
MRSSVKQELLHVIATTRCTTYSSIPFPDLVEAWSELSTPPRGSAAYL